VRAGADGPTVDLDLLRRATRVLTRALDNAVEYSLPHYSAEESRRAAVLKRRIGIGVCGLADLLLAHRLPYGSPEARRLARNVLSMVTFASKVASHELGIERGSCGAMSLPAGNRYTSERFLENKYGKNPTDTVATSEWQELGRAIRATRGLRNVSTTALPPTGRTSRILGVNPSIEPLFDLGSPRTSLPGAVLEFLAGELGAPDAAARELADATRRGTFQRSETLSSRARECLRTASEISVEGHLRMVADLAGSEGVVDESASKTVNLPETASVDDVVHTFLQARALGLKNIAVYRDHRSRTAESCGVR
jgi:ribonucleoside-diphosphate reductase alpha chain